MENRPAEPEVYEIRILGHLPADWAEWLSGLALSHLENGQTVLYGPVQDQAALHGLLARLRDLNLKLLSVNRLEG